MIYKVALFDDWGKHLATEPLEAEDHSKAQSAADIILGVCKDVAYSYEVRFNGVVVASGNRRRGRFVLSPLSGSPQSNVIDVVERLQHGFTAVALSRRLRKTTARLRRCGMGIAGESNGSLSSSGFGASPALESNERT